MSKRDRQRGLSADLQHAVITLVKPAREAMGLSHLELARALRVTEQTTRYVWEAEPRPLSMPTGARLRRLVRWLLEVERKLRRRKKIRRSLDELLAAPEAERRAAILRVDAGTPLAATVRALEGDGAHAR